MGAPVLEDRANTLSLLTYRLPAFPRRPMLTNGACGELMGADRGALPLIVVFIAVPGTRGFATRSCDMGDRTVPRILSPPLEVIIFLYSPLISYSNTLSALA